MAIHLQLCNSITLAMYIKMIKKVIRCIKWLISTNTVILAFVKRTKKIEIIWSSQPKFNLPKHMVQFLFFRKGISLNYWVKPVTTVNHTSQTIKLEHITIKGYSTSLVCYILKQIHNIRAVDSLSPIMSYRQYTAGNE